LRNEFLCALPGQRVEAGLTVVTGDAPFRANPSTPFKALERGIQRAVVHKQRRVRLFLDRAGYALTMLLPGSEDLQDQKVKRSLEQCDLFPAI
jgi:hypothetical protein